MGVRLNRSRRRSELIAFNTAGLLVTNAHGAVNSPRRKTAPLKWTCRRTLASTSDKPPTCGRAVVEFGALVMWSGVRAMVFDTPLRILNQAKEASMVDTRATLASHQHFGETYGGTAPENYERYFVPAIGTAFAADLIESAELGLCGYRPDPTYLDVYRVLALPDIRLERTARAICGTRGRVQTIKRRAT